MIKKIFTGLGKMFSSNSVSVEDFQKKKVVLSKEIVESVGNYAPKGITKTFSPDDPFVNIFVTIEWKKDSGAGAGIKETKWEWLTDGEVKHEAKLCIDIYDSPFSLIGNIRTDVLSIGKHSVVFYIDDELFLEEEFEIKENEVDT